MRTSIPTVSLVSSLVAAAIAVAPFQVASAAPEDEAAAEAPEGETAEPAAEGEAPEGEAAEPAEGEPAEGEAAEGEGEAAEGEGEPAEEAAEGEGEAAEEPAEEAPAEEAAEGEGESTEETPEETTPSFLDEEGDGRPPEPRIANKPAKGKGLMIAGGTVAGVGAGLTIAFSLMTRNCSFDGPLQCRLQNQDDFLIPLGAATLLTGTMILAVGIGYHVRYKKWETWSPEDDKKVSLIPVPTAMRRGAGLAWGGRF